MKKTLSIILVLAMVLACFAACGQQNSNEQKPADSAATEEKIKIGMSFATLQEARYNKEKAFMQAKADELGVEILFQDAGNDAAKQTDQVENLISQGIDVLVINCVDNNCGVNAAKICKEAGVGIIAYSRTIQSSDVSINLGYDGVWIGEQIAQSALASVPEGKYAIIAGDAMEPEGLKMYKGIWNILTPEIEAGKIEVVFDQFSAGWLAENALANAENALTQNDNDIDAILTLNDNLAGGIEQALKAQGLEGKVYLTGGDCDIAGCQRIAEGTQGMTVYYNNQLLAEAAVQGAYNYAKGDDSMIDSVLVLESGEEVPMIRCNVDIVSKDNLVEKVIDSGLYTLEDVFTNVPQDQWPK